MITAGVVAVLMGSALLGIITIGSGSARAATPPFRGLSVGLVNMNVVTYNPMAITLLDEYIVIYNVYSALVTYDASYDVQPDLASSWELSTDQKTWTFHLVHNAFFTDPTAPSVRTHPVTSADVLFSFQINQQQSASILHSYTTNIASMSAPDPFTFVVTTNQPFAAMYSTASAITILPKYVWQSIPNPVHYGNANPIGSNAMYYDTPNATFGSNIVLRRNPNYYGVADYCQVSRPDQVYFKDYTSGATMVSDFKSGTSGLDAIMAIDPASYLNALPPNSPGSKTTKFAVDTGFVGEVSVNVMTPQIRAAYSQFKNGYNNPLLLNDTVRTAIAMSIDKQPGYSLESVSQLSGALFTGDYDIWFWDWIFTPASAPALDVMEVETTGAIGPTSDNFYSNATFDGVYAQSLVTLDPAARRTLTDTLQKMVYDYHSYILPYYRLDLYRPAVGKPPAYTPGLAHFGNWSQSVATTQVSDL